MKHEEAGMDVEGGRDVVGVVSRMDDSAERNVVWQGGPQERDAAHAYGHKHDGPCELDPCCDSA